MEQKPRNLLQFLRKSEAISNGRGFAGNGNKKQWTLLCQMLPKPFHAFKCQGINDIYWRSTNQGINGLLQRPGLNTLRRILGLLLFLPWHSAWVSIYPGKPSHSSLPSAFLALVKGFSPPGGHWDSSAHLLEERWGAQADQGHTPGQRCPKTPETLILTFLLWALAVAQKKGSPHQPLLK